MASYMRKLATQRMFPSPVSETFPLLYQTLRLGRNTQPIARSFGNVSRTRSVITTPAYEGHIPLGWFENGFLALGSAVMSLVDPRRGGAEVDL